jgi:hypothetical protein
VAQEDAITNRSQNGRNKNMEEKPCQYKCELMQVLSNQAKCSTHTKLNFDFRIISALKEGGTCPLPEQHVHFCAFGSILLAFLAYLHLPPVWIDLRRCRCKNRSLLLRSRKTVELTPE